MNNTHTYKRFMRDGSVEERTGIIRSRAKKKRSTPTNGN